MRQSLEPLRRLVAPEEVRGQRALDVLEVSIDRLDHLVAYARRPEETTAELLDPPRQRICLTRIVERILSAYADTFASRRLILDARLQPEIFVLARDSSGEHTTAPQSQMRTSYARSLLQKKNP